MEKRLIIATVMSVLVLLIFSYFFQTPILTKKGPEKEIAAEKPVEDKKASAPEEKLPAKKAKQAPLPSEKEIIVETDLYKAILTNRGGVIKAWELKNIKITKSRRFS